MYRPTRMFKKINMSFRYKNTFVSNLTTKNYNMFYYYSNWNTVIEILQ